MTDYEVDPDANLLVRIQAEIFLAWRRLNNGWAEGLRNTTGLRRLVTITWPLIAVSRLLSWVYFLVTTPFVYPIQWLHERAQ